MAKRSRGRPQIAAEKRVAIIAALQANPNTAQVARQIDGISRTTVWHIAKAAGIALAARASPITEKRAAIITALQANSNAAQVARQIDGVSQATVWRIAKVAGIALAARGGRPMAAEKRAAIIAALQANPNARQVARQVGGVSHETVRHIAQAADIELALVRVRRIAKAGGPQTPANTFETPAIL